MVQLLKTFSVLIIHPWWQRRWSAFFAAAGTAWWQCSRIETVADLGCRAGSWQAGWLVDRSGAQRSDRAGRAPPAVVSVSVFTSCCSAVSLPRSSPLPGPCGGRVWGSGSCGC